MTLTTIIIGACSFAVFIAGMILVVTNMLLEILNHWKFIVMPGQQQGWFIWLERKVPSE